MMKTGRRASRFSEIHVENREVWQEDSLGAGLNRGKAGLMAVFVNHLAHAAQESGKSAYDGALQCSGMNFCARQWRGGNYSCGFA